MDGWSAGAQDQAATATTKADQRRRWHSWSAMEELERVETARQPMLGYIPTALCTRRMSQVIGSSI
jgi:hypothetical protein